MPVCLRKVDTIEDDEFSSTQSKWFSVIPMCTVSLYTTSSLVSARGQLVSAVKVDNWIMMNLQLKRYMLGCASQIPFRSLTLIPPAASGHFPPEEASCCYWCALLRDSLHLIAGQCWDIKVQPLHLHWRQHWETVQFWNFRSHKTSVPIASWLAPHLCPVQHPPVVLLLPKTLPSKTSAANLQLRICFSWKST